MTATNKIKQYDFTEAEVSKLFAMQDTLNSYIHSEWKTQGFNWGLAIVDECMEIHGHLGWKWWKQGYQQGLTPANIKQVQLEVIDILHFAVSQVVDRGFLPTAARYDLNTVSHGIGGLEYCVNFILREATEGKSDLHHWAYLAHSVDLTKQQILETYTQKYVLNKFRQDHGYKTGEYCKEWTLNIMSGDTIEDNEVLEFMVYKLKKGGHDTTDEKLLYSELATLYNSRLNKS
jgi:dimeric dUTPase (all-alpha-NTP-PPase superfamily)